MAKFQIENVVASTSLGEALDLPAIARALGEAKYEPEHFPGLIYRLRDPKATILLFRTGKVICTGAKSLEQVKRVIDLVAKRIETIGIPVTKNPNIEVQNLVATSDLGAPIDQAAVARSLHQGHVEYEPEQFPGLVYRIDEPRVVLLLFGNGKIVCTGAHAPADVDVALERIRSELKATGLLH
ncbi:MAG TPA: TATA-box-binding protein [Thermoplasmata archaeon]|nr:TATA-box-binding protein [Thermoplasmata archaeon]